MAYKSTPKPFRYYFAELLILVLGISLSFLLNEWRVGQSERNVEQNMLKQFRENLVKDSTNLSNGIEGLKIMLKASNDLLDLEAGDTYTDSVTINLINILNFSGFYPTDIAYEEMRSLGHSRLIRDKELIGGLIQLYESDYDLVAEWVGADRNFLLNDLLPHMNNHLPFARGLNFPALSDRKKRELVTQLVPDDTKYVIQSGQIMKAGTQQVYTIALTQVRKILTILEKEIED